MCAPHLLAVLLVLPLLLFFAGVCLGAGEGGAPSGSVVEAGAALEVGEMDPGLAEALNAFGAGRYDECRKLAEAVLVGRGFPAPPETTARSGGHGPALLALSLVEGSEAEGNARPTAATVADCVPLTILSHVHEGDFAAALAAEPIGPLSQYARERMGQCDEMLGAPKAATDGAASLRRETGEEKGQR